jgi:uncharacterized protein
VSQENVELVNRIYDAWNRGEVPGPTDLLDNMVEYVNPPGAIEPGTRRGLDAFTGAVTKMFESWETWETDRREFRTRNEHVAVALRYRARGRGSGLEIEGRESALWTVRGGKVVRYQWFHDSADAFKAIALEA